jgi:hypothetical protein
LLYVGPYPVRSGSISYPHYRIYMRYNRRGN